MVESTSESSAVVMLHSILSIGRGEGGGGGYRRGGGVGGISCITLEEPKLSDMLL